MESKLRPEVADLEVVSRLANGHAGLGKRRAVGPIGSLRAELFVLVQSFEVVDGKRPGPI
jgi:hypothetical protein